MIHLAIIGAGQLGSRHLQALALIDQPKKIFVVDPSQKSLDIAKQRFEEVSKTDIPEFVTKLPASIKSIDLAIVATSANHRLSALGSMYQDVSVKNVVLEKVLFQTPEEYEKATDLLNSNGTKAWVNCPRRMFPFYQELREQIAGEKIKSAKVSGSEWGMACNAIHYIDLFNFLNDSVVDQVYVNKIEKVFESKRPGFYEFFGELKVAFSSFDLQIFCEPGDLALKIEIELENKTLFIDEIKQTFTWIQSGESDMVTDYQVFYQSQLSHKVFKDIKDDCCQLTDFAVSKDFHLKYINALIPVFRDQNLVDGDVCPIT